MSSYAKVKGWSAMMEEVLLERRMPPWRADPHHGKFANDRSLAAAEAQALLRWIRQGCPRGEGEDPLEAAPASAPAWALGKPDFLVKPPKQEVPATGVLDYRFVDSDFVMPQDAWLRAAITRPGNRKVIHHIIVRVRYPALYRDRPEEAFLFTTWVPGLPQAELPAGTGLFVPKGSRFNFEVHYRTNGEAQTDESEVGLYLAKEKPKLRFETRGFETRDLVLAEPKLLPAGSWLLCSGAFDNSARNPNNPNPKARAHWGPQSWNEMFMGFVDVAEAPESGGAGARTEANGGGSWKRLTGSGRSEPTANATPEAK